MHSVLRSSIKRLSMNTSSSPAGSGQKGEAMLDDRGDMTKRAFDVLISGSLLVVLSPVMACVGLLVRLLLGRPVLFRQGRPGLAEEPFQMVKFRTMTDLRSPSGELLPDAARLTSFGSFLRRSSLDELPELVNVLRGEMSLVGPRPLLMRYTEHMTAEERTRYSVRPGVTGWAQVNGRNSTPWDERLAMDVWYVANRSLRLDLRILARTASRVLAGSGVHPDAEAVMQNLDDERRAE